MYVLKTHKKYQCSHITGMVVVHHIRVLSRARWINVVDYGNLLPTFTYIQYTKYVFSMYLGNTLTLHLHIIIDAWNASLIYIHSDFPLLQQTTISSRNSNLVSLFTPHCLLCISLLLPRLPLLNPISTTSSCFPLFVSFCAPSQQKCRCIDYRWTYFQWHTKPTYTRAVNALEDRSSNPC